ncbi:hypothetical protein SUDANB6_02096 [Streptomyces sp. enrichment culture]|uniref:anti-sigma factor family protein n=1 Tax=Streptomyces sp. enrichment culture TaxID=1795815 RepID=UPI003F56F722
MSGSRPTSAGHLAEQHLGDRLAALVDGELGHDARERVLAHVATCPKCKAEVDAQRRLKSVFAQAAPPPPSESLLARLQGLPGASGARGGSPLGGGGLPDGRPGLLGPSGRPGGAGVFGEERSERFEFGYVPSRSHPSALPASSPGRGFGVHDVSRHGSDRSASRGLRFAFAAAGAVSLAAIALGGVTAGLPDTASEARGGSGSGSNVTPARTQGATAVPESQRRRSAGPLLGQAQGQRSLGETPAAPATVSAPLLPGPPVTGSARKQEETARALTASPPPDGTLLSPLIRPLEVVPPLVLASWPVNPQVTVPGLFAAPGPAPVREAPSASARPAP